MPSTTWKAALRRSLAGSPGATRHPGREIAALAVITGAALLYLTPALWHGLSFGPTDLGQKLSLLTYATGAIHNNLNGDVITQGLAWQAVNWNLIHQGQFPLWNALSGNGLPQYLNFESASLSLPSLVSYAVPQAASLMVAVLVKLLIAGWGTYLCCRVIGVSLSPAVFGAATFMLSGPITGWLGWSASGVFVWSGAIVAGALLAYRGPHPRLGVTLLALSLAGAVYGGFPEGYALLALGLLCLGAAAVVAMMALGRRPSGDGLLRVAGGVLAGIGLSAPLWLPGLFVLRGAARGSITQAAGLPTGTALTAVTQGYCGLPTGDHLWFCSSNYYETASYVGPLCLLLALVALLALWRRPLVVGLGALAVAVGLTVYAIGPFDPVQALLRRTPLRVVLLDRMLPMLALALALLAALGLDATLRHIRSGRGTRLLMLPVLVMAAVVALMAIATFWADLSDVAEAARRHSLVWPTTLLVVMVVIVVVTRRWGAAGPGPAGPALVGGGLVGFQVLFLVIAGAGLNSAAPTAVPLTPALAQVRQLVGPGLLGLDGGNSTCRRGPPGMCGFRQWTGTGLYPEMNLLIGLPELAVHDPIVPGSYLGGWPVPDSGQSAPSTLDFNFFVPDINSVQLARRYGVTTVLTGPGIPDPAGMVTLATIRHMSVLGVPGSGRFSVTRHGSTTVLPSTQPVDNEYLVTIPPGPAGTLTARVTDVAGWSVYAGTRALPITRTSTDLMRIDLPSGTRSVELRYFPRGLDAGVLIGVVTAVVLAASVRWSRRRRRRAPAGPAAGT